MQAISSKAPKYEIYIGSKLSLLTIQGEIRLLKFSPDGKMLHFTTKLSNLVQSYNLADRHLAEFSSAKHLTSPTTIAVSPKSHIIITSSQNPPLTLMRYRQGPWEPVKTSISRSPASIIAFHPTRSHIFLMGFTDGSVALYDAHAATARTKSADNASPARETASFKRLHGEIRSEDGETWSITAAEFLPGTRNVAITTGLDGKCNIIDFEARKIMKSWSVQAPATTLAILPKSGTSAAYQPFIAVGRIDGQLRIYSKDGELLKQETVDEMNEPVTDVEWVSGKSPQPLGDWTNVSVEKNPLIDLNISPGNGNTNRRSTQLQTSSQTDSLPNTVRQDPVENIGSDDSTVRHSDSRNPGLQFPTYMDLFSPVKREPDLPHRALSPRSRPRITSKTFVDKSSNSGPRAKDVVPVLAPSSPRSIVRTIEPNAKFSQSKPFTPDTNEPKTVSFKSNKNSGTLLNIPAGLLAAQDDRLNTSSTSRVYSSTTSSANSEILARIKALSSDRPQQRLAGGVLSNVLSFKDKSRRKSELRRKPPSPTKTTPQVNNHDRSRLSLTRRSRVSIGAKSARSTVRSSRPRPRPRAQEDDEAELWLTDSDHENDVNKNNDNLEHTKKSTYSTRSQFAEIPGSLYTRNSSEETTVPSSMLQPASRSFTTRPFHAEFQNPNMLSETTISTRKDTASSSPEPQIPLTSDSETLMPGWAESYHGPVKVEHYLPRRASLHFQTPERMKSEIRSVLGPATGNEQRKDHLMDECAGCDELRARIERLEHELAQLKLHLLN
jgi:hypothetical protein